MHSVRLGYRLALFGTAYTDVVDLRVPVWEREWPVPVRVLTAALKLPRIPRGRVIVWVEPRSVDTAISTSRAQIRLRSRGRSGAHGRDAARRSAAEGAQRVRRRQRGSEARARHDSRRAAWWEPRLVAVGGRRGRSPSPSAAPRLVQRDRAGRRHVERLARRRERNRRARRRSARARPSGRPSRSAPSTNEPCPESRTRDRSVPPWATSAIQGRGASSNGRDRHAEDRARRRAQRLRPGRVGAARGQRDAGAERIRGAQQRPDVAGIAHVPERERQRRAFRAAERRAGRSRSTRGGWRASRARRASAGSTSSPATSSSTGSIPARARRRPDPRPRTRTAPPSRAAAATPGGAGSASASGCART